MKFIIFLLLPQLIFAASCNLTISWFGTNNGGDIKVTQQIANDLLKNAFTYQTQEYYQKLLKAFKPTYTISDTRLVDDSSRHPYVLMGTVKDQYIMGGFILKCSNNF